MEHQLLIVIFVILLGMFIHEYLNKPVWTICDTEKCPYCYGTDFCENIQMNNVVLTHHNFHDVFYNYLSVKNVYRGVYKNQSVVLKKLAHNSELDKLDDRICVESGLLPNCVVGDVVDVQNYEEKILAFLDEPSPEQVKYFKTCNQETSQLFLDRLIDINSVVSRENYLKNVWTTLQINVEPLILQFFNENYPVPHLYGACGRVIVLKNAGNPLYSIYSNDWLDRAYIAYQLLKGAKMFTEEHQDFHFYLTDVSPDNIVIDEHLKVSFVDLENLIIKKKENGPQNKHISQTVDDDTYVYNESEICNSSVSDHNYFTVCKYILSENAPFPMTSQGLLHSPPHKFGKESKEIFNLVKTCESPTNFMDRYSAADQLIKVLESVLSSENYEL